MSSVEEHYQSHLAPVYVWMAGGIEAALERGAAETEAVLGDHRASGTAIDLGAGFGMHAIPLARRGYAVLAVDSSPLLLQALRNRAGELPIQVIEADLLTFRQYVKGAVELILCMGDTLTHLPDTASVEQLFSDVASALKAGGTFVTTFRDYSAPLTGISRFIPVRSDDSRILTCYLEYSANHVTVHDLLHERGVAGWNFKASAYQKLRLSPQWVSEALSGAGFEVRRDAGIGGMVRLVARRNA